MLGKLATCVFFFFFLDFVFLVHFIFSGCKIFSAVLLVCFDPLSRSSFCFYGVKGKFWAVQICFFLHFFPHMFCEFLSVTWNDLGYNLFAEGASGQFLGFEDMMIFPLGIITCSKELLHLVFLSI